MYGPDDLVFGCVQLCLNVEWGQAESIQLKMCSLLMSIESYTMASLLIMGISACLL